MAQEYRDPTQNTAPVANTTAGKWTFSPPVGVAIITNTSGQPVYIRFNSSSAASATAFDYYLPNNTSQRFWCPEFGVQNWTTIGVWFPSGATVANFEIRGN